MGEALLKPRPYDKGADPIGYLGQHVCGDRQAALGQLPYPVGRIVTNAQGLAECCKPTVPGGEGGLWVSGTGYPGSLLPKALLVTGTGFIDESLIVGSGGPLIVEGGVSTVPEYEGIGGLRFGGSAPHAKRLPTILTTSPYGRFTSDSTFSLPGPPAARDRVIIFGVAANFDESPWGVASPFTEVASQRIQDTYDLKCWTANMGDDPINTASLTIPAGQWALLVAIRYRYAASEGFTVATKTDFTTDYEVPEYTSAESKANLELLAYATTPPSGGAPVANPLIESALYSPVIVLVVCGYVSEQGDTFGPYPFSTGSHCFYGSLQMVLPNTFP